MSTPGRGRRPGSGVLGDEGRVAAERWALAACRRQWYRETRGRRRDEELQPRRGRRAGRRQNGDRP